MLHCINNKETGLQLNNCFPFDPGQSLPFEGNWLHESCVKI